MSQTVLVHEVQQYTTNIRLLSQQTQARLAQHAMQQTGRGKSVVPVEQVGSVAAEERLTRYPDLVPKDVPATRPWVSPRDWDWNTMLDSVDLLRTLVDPKGAYALAATAGMNRRKDDTMIQSFFADRMVGQTGTTVSSFPAANQVGVNVGGTASDLNVPKLREAIRMFMAAEVDLEAEMPVCAITNQQHDALLNEINITSQDYNWGAPPVLKSGRVTEFLGIRFVHSERLMTDGSGYRRVPIWVPSGMTFCTWDDLTTDISQRKDKAGLPWQLYVFGTFNAVRNEDAKVLEIKCAES